jgi:hypothetical protein
MQGVLEVACLCPVHQHARPENRCHPIRHLDFQLRREICSGVPEMKPHWRCDLSRSVADNDGFNERKYLAHPPMVVENESFRGQALDADWTLRTSCGYVSPLPRVRLHVAGALPRVAEGAGVTVVGAHFPPTN